MQSQKVLRSLKFILIQTIISVLIFTSYYPSFSQVIPSNKSQQYPYFYKNPKVLDVEYKYKINLNSIKINRKEDLKVWIPVPRDWNTQKVVEISKIEPDCDKDYFDPEHGNRILFWDFGNYPEARSYEINICFRIENFQNYLNDSSFVKSVKQHNNVNYDKGSNEYNLYTRSTQKRVHLTPKITEMAKEAVGDETNPYLQSKAIFQYVLQKMRYVRHRKERGTGTDVLLQHPVVDTLKGKKYYEGQCGQFSGLFIALCRASGIPARPVAGFVQGRTDINEEDLEEYSSSEIELTPDGYAGTLHYFNSNKGMSAEPHVWAEFYYPEYGWIPVDVALGRTFGHLNGPRIIMSKGFDILWAPEFEADELKGYGYQWIPAENKRVDILQSGVWKISKLRDVSVKILYNTDPFPSEAFYEYINTIIHDENIKDWKTERLRNFYYSIKNEDDNIFAENSELKKDYEAYLCHLLHYALGDNSFKEFGNSYIKKRVNSGDPVSIDKLQDIIDSNCSSNIKIREWISDYKILPEFKLTRVKRLNNKNNWKVSGCIKSEGAAKFNVPVELEIQTSEGNKLKKIPIDSDSVFFNIQTNHEPQKLVIDPNYHFPTIRWIPPLIIQMWNAYPDFTVVYGTLKEAEENKNTAMRFFHGTSGLSTDLIKKDTEITSEDLSKKRIILIGRPETNLISKKFEEQFPIKFDGSEVSFKGELYNNPDLGVVQIIENNNLKNGMLIMCAGLSSSATETIYDTQKWDDFPLTSSASFVLYKDFKIIGFGKWEDTKSDMIWCF